MGPWIRFRADLTAAEIRYPHGDEWVQKLAPLQAPLAFARRTASGRPLYGDGRRPGSDRRMATIVVTRFTPRQPRHGPMPRQSLRAA